MKIETNQRMDGASLASHEPWFLTKDREKHAGAHLMRSILRVSDDLKIAMSHELHLNDLAMRAMMYLMETGPVTIGELARHLDISKTLATVVVDRLEATGHGSRQRDTHDRRRVLICPNSASANNAMGMLQPVILESDVAFQRLDDAGKAAVVEFLSTTLRAMHEQVVAIKHSRQNSPATSHQSSPTDSR